MRVKRLGCHFSLVFLNFSTEYKNFDTRKPNRKRNAKEMSFLSLESIKDSKATEFLSKLHLTAVFHSLQVGRLDFLVKKV